MKQLSQTLMTIKLLAQINLQRITNYIDFSKIFHQLLVTMKAMNSIMNNPRIYKITMKHYNF